MPPTGMSSTQIPPSLACPFHSVNSNLCHSDVKLHVIMLFVKVGSLSKTVSPPETPLSQIDRVATLKPVGIPVL